MATKAELEWQRNNFHALAEDANAHLASNDLAKALASALSSFQFIDGMIQFERRYNKIDDIKQPTLKIVLLNAPVLFRWQAIDEAESLIERTKRIQKYNSTNWKQKIEGSRQLLNVALELWNRIDRNQDINEVNRTERIYLLNAWERLLLVEKDSSKFSKYSLNSSMTVRYLGKCHSCGLVCDSTKEYFLQAQKCPECNCVEEFVILGPAFRKDN